MCENAELEARIGEKVRDWRGNGEKEEEEELERQER